MVKKNKPLAAQQPPPAYANDPSGFFGAALADNRANGLYSLLPSTTVNQSDVAVKGRLLAGQIAWTPCQVRWKGCVLSASMADAQFLLLLQAGGDEQQGKITVLVNKLDFGGFGKGLPAYGDTLEVQAGGAWHQFVISELFGQYDDNDPGMTLTLEQDQSDNGD